MREVTFDTALRTVVRAAEESIDLTGCEVTVVRDLIGRLRLHAAAPAGGPLPEGAEAALRAALAKARPYAADVVFLDRGGKPGFPLVDVLRRERVPVDTGDLPAAPRATWFRFERRFAKDSWLREFFEPREPWPETERPIVISFYGFKGGVGRTTALAAFALFLSEERGKTVVAVDLDLEAPGIGPLLAQGSPVDLGVVDHLLEERLAPSEPLPMSRFYVNVPVRAGSLRVFPAGRLDGGFLEKLGRLDVQGVVDPNAALRDLLLKLLLRVKQELRPDAVLLDVRAGLHDLGGITMSGLSHLELVFAVHSEQAWSGLPIVLAHLGRLRADWVKLVHAMVPPRTRGGDDLHAAFLTRAYDVCSERYYREDEIPQEQDETATHRAYRLPHVEGLMALSDLERGKTYLLADEYRTFCERLAADVGL